ncbi:hemagglutinin/amebocyte aggregation factor-like [Morone saxatilis]|uniref:hemagglutinin/amebocyte aggregation factor-like n=1 Tax=Morone saxatilis TaxID=34816 RepID=UPI0015E207A6|nr:hemagglutinin/amebocyte aggregation factor-like [Morone saxatilis]
MWTFIVVLVILTAEHRAQDHDDALGDTLLRLCPGRHVVSQIKSSHSPTHNDRQWKIECKALDSIKHCSWSGIINAYDQEFIFDCPKNHVVAGIWSEYVSYRRWSFFCCSAEKLITSECQETPMVNYWNEDFHWYVPDGNFLTGISSHNKNNNGDYRWRFKYCRGTTQGDWSYYTLLPMAARD